MGRILVADYEPPLVDLLQAILTSAGHEVSVASSYGEAVSTADKVNPDVILLDWLRGVDVPNIAKQLKRRSNLKLILASPVPDIKEKAAIINADGFLAMPFCIEDLVDTVERCLEIKPPSNAASALLRLSQC